MEQSALRELLNDMSLEEKIGQMSQVHGSAFFDNQAVTGPMQGLGFTEERLYLAGSVIGLSRAEDIKKVQKEYMDRHPHRIPLLFMLDVINGFATSFPIPLAQGAAFEPELSTRCAQAAAAEAAAQGVHVTFAPMADLVRDARWGRVMESTGEDPMLNGQYAAAMVKGFQGEDVKDAGHVAACVKHFAGYGAPVAGREYHTVELSEHTFREFYLPAYRDAIDGGSLMAMTAFNTVDGIPATGNRKLMRDILREEMQFQGVLISDWGAIGELVTHGYCEDRSAAAVRAIRAGVDIDMMAGVYNETLGDLAAEGVVSEAEIDEAVWRILELKNKLGLFENPYKDADPKAAKLLILCGEHRKLAKEAAEKSFVLLKNEAALPLDKKARIAFIGPYVDNRAMHGAWSIFAREDEAVTVQDAVEQAFADAVCHPVDMVGISGEISLDGEAMEEILRDAAAADVVVLTLGEHREQSGEAASRGAITVPETQLQLLRSVQKVNPNLVTVLFNGRPLDIREISERSKAVLAVWMPGTEGGPAIVDTLCGDVVPSGKLTMSFPYCVGQVPISYNSYSTGRPRREENQGEKYTSGYLDIPNEPLYPFGYGLSYTSFSISPVSLDRETMGRDDTLLASVTVKNTGSCQGTEVLQLYIQDLAASVVRPVKELKAYQKLTLLPGQERRVTFEVKEEMLRFYTENQRFESEDGEFRLGIGVDSRITEWARFRLQ